MRHIFLYCCLLIILWKYFGYKANIQYNAILACTFFTPFWRSFLCFQGVFFRKFCPKLWLLFKSRLWYISKLTDLWFECSNQSSNLEETLFALCFAIHLLHALLLQLFSVCLHSTLKHAFLLTHKPRLWGFPGSRESSARSSHLTFTHIWQLYDPRINAR